MTELTSLFAPPPPSQSNAPKFTKGKVLTKQGPSGPIEYEVFGVVDEYSDALITPAYKWDFANPPGDLPYIAVSLIATMLKHYGMGLAANQCDLPYSIFVMGLGANYVETVVNPEILERGEEEEESSEGCLSYPGVYLDVKRSTVIKARYFNTRGEEQVKEFSGLTARVFQHELDHLLGVRFTEYVSKFDYQRAKAKAPANLRRQRAQLEQAAAQLRQRKALETAQRRAQDQTKLVYTVNSEAVLTVNSAISANENTKPLTIDTGTGFSLKIT